MRLSSLTTKLLFIGCGEIAHILPLHDFAREYGFQIAASFPPADLLFSGGLTEAESKGICDAAPQVAILYCPYRQADALYYIRSAKKLAPQILLICDKKISREEARKLEAFGAVALPVHSDERAKSDFRIQLVLLIRNARIASYAASLGMTGVWSCFPEAIRAEVEQAGAGCKTIKAIAIGASAGGTDAIARLVTRLPADFPCLLIVQHMPKDFTAIFADGLNKKCAAEVSEAHDGDPIVSGRIYIAPGDRHMTVERRGSDYVVRIVYGEKISGHRPSVNALFSSVARMLGDKAIGVILTGMGADGAEGLLFMKNAGAYTIGQDAATSAIYGMPEAAYKKGAVRAQLPLDRIADELVRLVGRTEGHEDGA